MTMNNLCVARFINLVAGLVCVTILVSQANYAVAQTAKDRQATSNKVQNHGSDHHVMYKKVDGDDLRLFFFEPVEQKITGSKTVEPKSNKDSPEQPECRPAIVFFFGGGWVGGSPSQFKPHAEYLKSRGMVAVLADYRTQKSHSTSPVECVKDAKSAVRYLRSNAKRLRIDPDRIAAAGGSAGGHLAAATATLASFDEEKEDLKISAVPNALVLFNPVFNNGPGQWGHKKVEKYWREISPAHNIRPGMPPAIVFLGDDDKLISVKTVEAFRDAMQTVKSKSELHVYNDMGHGFFNFGRHDGTPFKDTVLKMDRFLVATGFLTGPATVDAYLKPLKK